MPGRAIEQVHFGPARAHDFDMGFCGELREIVFRRHRGARGKCERQLFNLCSSHAIEGGWDGEPMLKRIVPGASFSGGPARAQCSFARCADWQRLSPPKT